MDMYVYFNRYFRSLDVSHIFFFCIDQSTSIKYTRTSSSITSEFRPKNTCDIIVIIDYVLMFVFDNWSKISLF